MWLVPAVVSCLRSADLERLVAAVQVCCTGVVWMPPFPSKLACGWQCGGQVQVSDRMLVGRNLMKLVMDRLAGGIQLSPPPSKVLLSCDLWMRSEGT